MSSASVSSRSPSPEPAPVPQAGSKGRPMAKARKPSGKKGKVFVEEKSSLLDLIDQVAGKKDDERAEKLEKYSKVAKVDHTIQKAKNQRKLDRSAPLRAAKKAIKDKEKARQSNRREKKKGPKEGGEKPAPVEKKRKVAFA